MDNTKGQNDEIDLLDMFRLVWSKKAVIALIVIVSGLVGFLYSKIFIAPRYEASINMIVNSRNDSTIGNISNDNIASSQNMAKTCAVIIKVNILYQVIDELNLDISYEKLKEMVTVESVNSTQVMNIVVNDTDPERAKQIVEKIGDIAPEILVDAIEGGSCKIVSDVYSTGKPVSPNSTKNGLLVALIALVICIAVIIVRDLLDNTFKSELDIQNITSLPVLGVLPSVESCMTQPQAAKRRR